MSSLKCDRDLRECGIGKRVRPEAEHWGAERRPSALPDALSGQGIYPHRRAGGRRSVTRLEELDCPRTFLTRRAVLAHAEDEVYQAARRRVLGIQLIIGQVRKALGRAVVVLHVEPAADDILPQRAPGPGIHERLVQRLTGAGPRLSRPSCRPRRCPGDS